MSVEAKLKKIFSFRNLEMFFRICFEEKVRSALNEKINEMYEPMKSIDFI